MKDVPTKSSEVEYALGMVPRSSSAATKDVRIKSRKEECVQGMGQRHIVTTKDVPTKSSKEEYVLDMAPRSSSVATKDVRIKSRKEECV